MRKAIIAGATGLIGSYLVRLLAEDESYELIYSLARREGSIQYTGPGSEKVKELIVDYNQLDLASLEVDDIFCALGTTMKIAGSKEKFYMVDHDYVLAIAEKGQANGASQFLMVSSIGASANSSNFYLKVKGETESDITSLGFLSTVIFRPSLLVGPRKENRPMEKFGEVVLKIFKPIMFGALKKQIPVHASQVAAAMISEAKKAEPGKRLVDSNLIRSFSSAE